MISLASSTTGSLAQSDPIWLALSGALMVAGPFRSAWHCPMTDPTRAAEAMKDSASGLLRDQAAATRRFGEVFLIKRAVSRAPCLNRSSRQVAIECARGFFELVVELYGQLPEIRFCPGISFTSNGTPFPQLVY